MRKNRSLAILSGSLIFCLGIYIISRWNADYGRMEVESAGKSCENDGKVFYARTFLCGKRRKDRLEYMDCKKSDADDSAWKLCGRERNL